MKSTEFQAELIVDAQAELGEGPHWDAESNQLYWVDVTRRKLRIYNRITGNEIVRSFDRMISAVIPTTSGDLHWLWRMESISLKRMILLFS